MNGSIKAVRLAEMLEHLSYRDDMQEFQEGLQEAAREMLRLSVFEKTQQVKLWQRIECTRCGKFLERS